MSDEPGINDAIRQPARERQAAMQHAMHERLFGPKPEPVEPSTEPQGDADAGKGTAGEPTYEHTPSGFMRVFSEAELTPDNERQP